MKTGVLFHPVSRPSSTSGEAYFQEALNLSELADRLGYSRIGVVEHYFMPYGGYTPDPCIFLAAAAQRTRRARLMTSAVLPVFNHPLKLAGQLAMVDCISGGRLDVGVGRAFVPLEFQAFGISMDESRARFEEGVEALVRLFTEENMTFEGRFHRWKGVTSLPKVVQQPHPPLWVAAAVTPESYAWTGRKGYGVMSVPYLFDFSQTAKSVQLYRDTYRDTGHRGEARVALGFHIYLAEDRNVALEEGRRYMTRYMEEMQASLADWDNVSSSAYQGYTGLRSLTASFSYERLVEERRIIFGDAEDAVRAIRYYREVFGDFELLLMLHFGDMGEAPARRTAEIFAHQVMPRLQNT